MKTGDCPKFSFWKYMYIETGSSQIHFERCGSKGLPPFCY